MTCGRIIEDLMVSRHRDTHLRLDRVDHNGALESTQTRHIIGLFLSIKGPSRPTHLRLGAAHRDGVLEKHAHGIILSV
jgi:hypothetical protein